MTGTTGAATGAASSLKAPSARSWSWTATLAVVAGAGAALAAVAGLLASADPVLFVTARAQPVELFGSGVYRYDSLFAGAGNRGTDAITLAIVLPLLVVALVGRRRGSLRAGLLLTGALAWLVYVYATMAVGAAFNPLFLLYVGVFAAAFWAFVLAMADVDADRLDVAAPSLPRRGPAVLMIVSGLVTAVVWLGPVVAAQLTGATPARLDGYTTLVTAALDSAVITPAALAAGLLIWRGRALGYRIAVPLLVIEALLAPLIVVQTVSQLSAGVTFAPAEIVGPIAGFVALSVAASIVLWVVLRGLPAADRDRAL